MYPAHLVNSNWFPGSLLCEAMYAEEWEGWDDFLGVILPFKQADLEWMF